MKTQKKVTFRWVLICWLLLVNTYFVGAILGFRGYMWFMRHITAPHVFNT